LTDLIEVAVFSESYRNTGGVCNVIERQIEIANGKAFPYRAIVSAGSNLPATVGDCALLVALLTCSDR
jgi:hypothetical protein